MEALKAVIRERMDGCADQAERLAVLADLQQSIDFERRLAELTHEQHRAMVDADESRLSDQQRASLDAAKSASERDRLIESFARANYMRQCAWVDYLNGGLQVMPVGLKGLQT